MWKDVVFGIGVCVLLIALLMYGFVYMHEAAHVVVFKEYGISSEVTISIYGGITKPTEPVPENIRKEMDVYHLMIDIIGYHLLPFYVVMVLYFVFGVVMPLVTQQRKNF